MSWVTKIKSIVYVNKVVRAEDLYVYQKNVERL